jgi:hypothetical protein
LLRLPALAGKPIRVRFLPGLRVHRGRLVCGGTRGEEVHAGSFLRKREIVLSAELAAQPRELARILLHELFHFVWLRAGNGLRRAYAELLKGEIERRARGELGWSAERSKRRLRPGDIRGRTRRWRHYVCESFCDSAAWLYSDLRRHEEFTLASGFRERRQRWFGAALGAGEISI